MYELKALRVANRKPKQLLAELTRDKQIVREVRGTNHAPLSGPKSAASTATSRMAIEPTLNNVCFYMPSVVEGADAAMSASQFGMAGARWRSCAGVLA
jgi:hypothetical protein